jgi:lipid-A-disaccharide synthase
MPGSRRPEVSEILVRELAIARTIAAHHRDVRFVVPLADPKHRPWAEAALAAAQVPVRVVVGRTHEVERAADLAITASGTATLELAYYGTPMVVLYNVTWARWNLLGRWLVRTPHLALPNALAGREIVPEFMRNRPADTAKAARAALDLLDDAAARGRMAEELRRVREAIAKTGSSENAAREALALVGTPVPAATPWRPGFAM